MKKIKKSLKEVKKILKPQETVSLLFLFIFLFSSVLFSLPQSVAAASTITNVTFNGESGVTVNPGDEINVVVFVSGIEGGSHWKSTGFQVLPETSFSCEAHKDHNFYQSNGSATHTFSFYAPSNPGTYDFKVTIYHAANCNNENNNRTFVGSIIVGSFELDTYTLAFNSNPVEGGTATDETNNSPYEAGSFVSIKAEANSGYQFVNWTASAGTFDNVNATGTIYTMPAQNATVTANFIEVIEVYTVTFINEGEIHATTTVEHGATTTLPVDPEKGNNTFEGWNIDSGGSGDWFTSDTEVTESITVYAIWQEVSLDTYTVVFRDWDDQELDTQIVNHEDDATAPSDPEREGYTFTGWDTSFTNVTENLIVTAEYQINEYTVTFFIDEGEIHTTTTVEHGATTTLPADPEKEGYTFEGWEHCYQNEIKVCEPFSEEIIIIEDMDVYAAWKQKVIEKDPEEEPTTPTTVVRRSGGGYTAPSEPEPEGEVLGEEIMAECGIYLFEYIKEGADNNPIEVQKLQTFLNQHMGESLPVTGFYGSASREALNRFQLKYKEEVLQPWVDAGVHCDVNQPTGYVYKTTQRWINLIMCPTLDLPIPDLSSYPETDCTGYLGQVLGEEIEWVDEEVTEEEPLLEEEPEVLDEPELPLEEVVEETEEEEESFMAIWLLLLALVVILILAFYFLKKPKKA